MRATWIKNPERRRLGQMLANPKHTNQAESTCSSVQLERHDCLTFVSILPGCWQHEPQNEQLSASSTTRCCNQDGYACCHHPLNEKVIATKSNLRSGPSGGRSRSQQRTGTSFVATSTPHLSVPSLPGPRRKISTPQTTPVQPRHTRRQYKYDCEFPIQHTASTCPI